MLLIALFFVADGPGRPATDFNTGSGQPLVLVYLLVFIVSQAVPCVTIFRQCGPYARMTGKASLRQALRMLSVAAVILFLYCTCRTVNILTAAAGIDIGVWQLASNVFSAAGIVTLSLSLTTSSWERRPPGCWSGPTATVPTGPSTRSGGTCTSPPRTSSWSRRARPRSRTSTTACTAA